MTMRKIETLKDVQDGLSELARLDSRLESVILAAGDVPVRRVKPGFAALASIIISQQVSRASADAILGRFSALVQPLDAAGVLACGDDVFRRAGLSRPKQKTMLTLAMAVVRDGLDLDHLAAIDGAEAMAQLTGISGIGPWTAEVYLLSCAGHPDVFPAHDVALQGAVAHAFAMDERPTARALYRMAESWAPWRAVAARLFWAYWRELHGKDAAPVLAG